MAGYIYGKTRWAENETIVLLHGWRACLYQDRPTDTGIVLRDALQISNILNRLSHSPLPHQAPLVLIRWYRTLREERRRVRVYGPPHFHLRLRSCKLEMTTT